MKTTRIKFIAHCAGIEFFHPVKRGMTEAAALFGAQTEFTGTEEIEVDRQVEMMREATAEGYDGLAITITDPEKFRQPVQEALRRSIPVIAFNCDASGGAAGHLSLIAQDLYQAGRRLAARASKKLRNQARILLTLHSTGASALEERRRGIQDGLKNFDPRWQMVITGNSVRESIETIEKELRKNQEISAILCTGHDDTEAAGIVLEKIGNQRSCIAAGFDVSREILRLISRGSLFCTIDQQPYLQGFYPVMQIVQYLRYGLSPSSVNVGACVIDRKNVDGVIKAAAAGYR